MDARIRRSVGDVPTVSTEELARSLDEGADVLLLDVRSPAEFAVGRLAGARRVQDTAQARRLVERHDGPVVAYCSVGVRSAELVAALREAGFGDVSNLRGSLFAWANEGRALVDDAGPTRFVHPYDERWGVLLHRDRWAPGARR